MRPIFTCAVAVALFLTAASGSDAQTLDAPSRRPSQGLFGLGPQRDQSLDLSLSVLGTFDDDVVGADNARVSDPVARQSGSYGGVSTKVAYVKKSKHVEFGLSQGSAARYYPTLRDLVAVQHSAAVGTSLHFGATRVTISQTLAYLPWFAFISAPRLFRADLADLPPAISDAAIVRREERLYGSSVGLTQALGGRTSLSFSASRQSADFVDGSTGLKSASVGGRVSRNLTRDVSLVAGYSYQQGTYRQASTAPQVTRLHNIDLGIDYSHALGRTRRTTIGFTTGATAVEDTGRTAQYRLTGSARLNREIGRTWHATAAYNRGVGFIDGFQQPFFSDAFAATVGGTVKSTVELSLAGSYSTGYMGLAASSNKSSNYNSSARVRVALSSFAAISGEYVVYHYGFEGAAALPEGVPPSLSRHGARIGLDLWIPLIR